MNVHTGLARTARKAPVSSHERTLTYTFEELPTIISDDGFELAPVSGSAEITYRGYYDCEVDAIYLDGSRNKTPAELIAEPNGRFIFQQIKLDQREHQTLWCAISDQLTDGSFRWKVESAIQEALDWEE